MNTRQILDRVRELPIQIELEEALLDHLRGDQMNLTSPSRYTEHSNSRKFVSDASFVSLTNRILDLEQQIRQSQIVIETVRDAIFDLEDQKERLVLAYYYLYAFSLVQVGKKIRRSSRSVRRIRERAIEHLKLSPELFSMPNKQSYSSDSD